MGSRSSVVIGLLAGLVVAAGIYVALVALAPETGVAATPAPTLVVSPSPAPSAGPSGGAPSASAPAASGSAGPTPSPTAPSSASPASSLAAESMIGQPVPALRVTQLGGGTVDLAGLRGKPVWISPG